MKDYEEAVVECAMQLVTVLKNLCNESSTGIAQMNLAQKINYFTFNSMADMAFGGGFELLRDNDPDGFYNSVGLIFIRALFLMEHTPWLSIIIRAMTLYNGSKARLFRILAAQQAQKRMQEGIKRKDLFCYLGQAIDDEADTPTVGERRQVKTLFPQP
ncbi:hypothetical protein M422DRAFT_268571 [Sphaerobolus stellatus SS14]|uniref:Uncharacterized protein n=1 Tax=Sphaerobolus stellatus (strain SS14) TaxID=990650 RepID=A0A0C9UM95_SPHS4|nr:hypothetical protein M422DRAFT_268571 [Sphaerobolus stellatus SS14]